MASADLLAALRWWLALTLLGLAAAPVTLQLLRSLPDRGYAFTKMIGLLIAGFVFWLFGSLGFLGNSLGGVLFGVGVLLILSLIAAKKLGANQHVDQEVNEPFSFWSWLRQRWTYVLTVELLFLVVFLFWAWVRTQNPAIVATEKPMEFAFLNSLGRSQSFPPLDPWLSGFGISYYYFGYLMTSMLARLAMVQEQVAFNLAIAWLTAGTALGAFGLTYNLIAADKEMLKRWATTFGLVAAIALPIAGNLEIVLEVLHVNDFAGEGFWQWLDVRDLTEPAVSGEPARYESSGWWWWRSSRVIHEYHLSGRPEEGLEPIAEFPAFSFQLGDLHAHVLALPFAFVSLAVALAWWLEPKRPTLDFREWFHSGALVSQFRGLLGHHGALLLFTAVVLGGLSFLNTWDVLIHLFVIVGAFALAQWRVSGRWRSDILRQSLTLGLILVAMAIVLYLPFYLGLRSQAAPPYLLPMIMRPTRLAHFLIIFGMPLVAVTVLVAALLSWMISHRDRDNPKRTWLTAVLLVVGLVVILLLLMLFLGWLIASNPDGMNVLSSTAAELGLNLPAAPFDADAAGRFGWAFSALGAFTPLLLEARITQPALILFLGGLLAAVVYLVLRMLQPHSEQLDEHWPQINNPTLVFVLLLIATATLLALGPEFVYLRDNFGQRINTIFKFYYQAWVLFGVAALFGLAYLVRRFRIAGYITTALYMVLLAGSLLFPYYAIQSRAIEYRGPADAEQRRAATLDGLEYVRLGNPDEFDAIMWLRENIVGSPVILEAVGGQYSQFGRIAASTGLPTVLGWAGHEYQWRGDTPEPGEREPVVLSIYTQPDWPTTELLLDRYGIDYIYVGQLERSTYDPLFEEKFEQNMEVVFRNETVTIYYRPSQASG